MVSHRGRIGVNWQPSSDAWGVAGYRISRSGAPLATIPADSTTYWDHQVSPGQAYSYSVVAYDDAGNVSPPATVDVGQPAEAADRAWVSDRRRAGVVRTHRRAGRRATRLHGPDQEGLALRRAGPRHQLGTPRHPLLRRLGDGGVAYCRNVGDGAARRGVACTTMDPDTLTWGYDRIAGPTDRTLEEDRTWVSTGEGPALCGRTGSPAHQRVGCTVLTDAGWTFVGLGRDTAWGRPGSRVFLSADDGTVSYCRRIAGAGDRLLASCTPFDPATLSWGYDRISRRPSPTADDNRTWVTTGAGPALCGRTGTERDQRLGCSVLTDAGWTFTGLGRSLAWGDPASRAFVRSGDNGVSYCRTVAGPAGDRAACTRFDAARSTWGRDRVAGAAERTLADSRTWQETPSGPALCGRTGNEANQRLACTVLTPRGWSLRRTGPEHDLGRPRHVRPRRRWRPVLLPQPHSSGQGRSAGLHEFDATSRVWRRDRVSGPAHLTISDPF